MLSIFFIIVLYSFVITFTQPHKFWALKSYHVEIKDMLLLGNLVTWYNFAFAVDVNVMLNLSIVEVSKTPKRKNKAN